MKKLKTKKSFRIGKFLKKLEKRIHSLPNLYSGCSEIIHPNAIPSLTAAEILGSDDNDKPSIRVMRFATDRKRMSEIYFDVFFMSLVGATGVNFLRDTNPILKEKIIGLKRVEAKAMKKLRPLGRRYLNMSLNHLDLDCFGDQLLCPCGS